MTASPASPAPETDANDERTLAQMPGWESAFMRFWAAANDGRRQAGRDAWLYGEARRAWMAAIDFNPT